MMLANKESTSMDQPMNIFETDNDKIKYVRRIIRYMNNKHHITTEIDDLKADMAMLVGSLIKVLDLDIEACVAHAENELLDIKRNSDPDKQSYLAKWYQENKAEYRTKANQKVACECGIVVARCSLPRHRKSVKHIQIMEGK